MKKVKRRCSLPPTTGWGGNNLREMCKVFEFQNDIACTAKRLGGTKKQPGKTFKIIADRFHL